MDKQKVGIYRTVYPLYSETFISEQVRTYSQYQPLMICRELIHKTDSYDTSTINKNYHFLKRFAFTAFGDISFFDNQSALNDIELLHAHFLPDAVLAMPLARRLRVPFVITCHGSDVLISDKDLVKSKRFSNLRYLVSRKKLIREASLFIAVSDFLRNAMIQKGFPAHKVVKHYVGVDTTKLVPGRPLLGEQTGNEQFILSIARHTDVKGIDLLLKAFARVARLHPDLYLVQIGDGPLTTELKSLATRLNIDQKVKFLGAKPAKEVLNFLQRCTALVLSSRKARDGSEEAFGLVLIEASACNIPCVGTRVGGIPEAIVDGETGIIAEPENVEDLAEKITALVSDRTLAQAMGRRGREMVCDMFDIKKQTKKLETLYSQLL